ncbi:MULTISPECIES: ABC transporter permease [Sulfitobacter]|uniref:ABC transporter permease n=1 Tax=Sulfitobacter faviae TaxID=1775881 RepID=A0ABZ0V8I7_9RHOB|nr:MULTISPECIES: ABC transporter permease [Sulfitobacter]MBO9431944.1 ABC transporter permease [Sulfitobacter sp. R18_1]MDF3384082.1 ABC transporter permease [Sulfitobacter sp. Ks11]MDF3387381.1 ABC transporter permease [Sulfitobacter sp. M85]MDF3390913.1 ABC transporter permease [Sulfitobacter sp. Ks16]MDF3401537.1 ABC transporter permease [Sulfitobacter sp. KE39]
MLSYFVTRLAQAVVVVFAMSVIVFVGVFAIGNPIDVMIDPGATAEIRQKLIEQYGLDQPLVVQYWTFLKNVAQGDLGTSMVYNIPVVDLVFSRFPATLELVLTSVLIAVGVGIPAGLWAGYRPESLGAKMIMALSVLGFSVPTFWIGMLLIMGFAVELGWLPSGGRGDEATFLGITSSLFTPDGWSHVIMPAINLSLFKMGLMIRLTRAGMVEAMGTDYVKFARAQGLPDRQIVFRHILRNISIPIVTVLGLELGSTLAFAVVTESVFNWPGVGKLIIDSILQLDRPVMVSYLIMVVILFVLINLVVDLVYARLDPRVRLKGGA